jgi:integrase
MPASSIRVPKLRRHTPSGRAVVTLGGQDHYLGPWPANRKKPPPAVQTAYDAKIAEWLSGGRVAAGGPAEGVTVSQLIEAFWAHAEKHYRRPDGTATDEVADFRISLRPLRHLYADLPAGEFSPLKLKAVRQLMLDGYTHPKYGPQEALSRGVINQRIGRIVRAFKWGVAEELAPASVFHGLQAVRGLERGRTEAHEPEPVTPVAKDHVEATVPFLLPQTQAMVRLQLLTGMRPGEACMMRTCDIDTSGPVWIYRPRQHKTAHRGRARTIAIGPKAQAVLRPWLRMELEAYLFQPCEAMEAFRAEQREKRKTRVQPSQRDRSKKRPKKRPGERYTNGAYGRAIATACRAANAKAIADACEAGQDVADDAVFVPHWAPNQLRHTHGTEVRRQFGLEAAQVALGHSSADITQVYAERDLTLAVRVALEIG